MLLYLQAQNLAPYYHAYIASTNKASIACFQQAGSDLWKRKKAWRNGSGKNNPGECIHYGHPLRNIFVKIADDLFQNRQSLTLIHLNKSFYPTLIILIYDQHIVSFCQLSNAELLLRIIAFQHKLFHTYPVPEVCQPFCLKTQFPNESGCWLGLAIVSGKQKIEDPA